MEIFFFVTPKNAGIQAETEIRIQEWDSSCILKFFYSPEPFLLILTEIYTEGLGKLISES